MKNRFLFGLVALAAAASSHAAETALPAPPLAAQPLVVAPAAKTGTLMRSAMPPTVSATSVTRQRDGTLSMNCVQKPNPKLRAANARANGVQQP